MSPYSYIAGKESKTRGRDFVEFVEKTLVLLRKSPIKSFSLEWKPKINKCRVKRLIHNALERGILELHLSSPMSQPLGDSFFSKTLVKLTLSNGCYYLLPRLSSSGGVLFPALKTLSLWTARTIVVKRKMRRREKLVTVKGSDLYDCLLASPLLEEFNVCDDDPVRPGWIKEVWGSTIQRISIFYRSHNIKDYKEVVIKTPNLVYLDYSSYVSENYVVQLDSLVEARLDLRLWKYYDYFPPPPPVNDRYLYYILETPRKWGDAFKLIAAIKNVVSLHLSADSLEVFYSCYYKPIPEFNNLVKLSFESHKERGWQVLPLLFKKSPNLETLVIKGLRHKITRRCGDACVCVQHDDKKEKRCCLLTCRVKLLKIYGYEGSCIEVKQMRHFMENLRCLEMVKVKVQVDHQDKYLPLTNELMQLLPIASSKRKIQII